MINNPQVDLPSIEVTLLTPAGSASVSFGDAARPDAISVSQPQGAQGTPGSLLEAALHDSQAAPAGVPAARSVAITIESLEAAIARFTSAGGDSPSSALSNAAVVRLLVSAALGGQATAGGLSRVAAQTLASAASLLRAAAAAPSPAAAAALMDDLAKILVSEGGELAQAAAASAQRQPPATSQSVPLALPAFDPSARLGRPDAEKAPRGVRVRDETPERDLALPDRDRRGRLYDPYQRRRLASLAMDPRFGYAPEGRIALAGEGEHGLQLSRTYDPHADFADASGGRWIASEPRSIRALEAVLRRIPPGTSALVSAASLSAPERTALGSLAARAALAAGAPRILIVDGGEK